MVAVAGDGWVLAPCLVRLMVDIDTRWPDRAKASDGSIGDRAHASRTSDHNPSGGYVRAVDITEDHQRGPSLSALWDHWIATRPAWLRYLIYEGRIVKGYVDGAGRPAWVPQVYSGSNPHTQHLHVSAAAGHENDRITFPGTAPTPQPVPDEEDDMPRPKIIYAPGKPTVLADHETWKALQDNDEVAALVKLGYEKQGVTPAEWDQLGQVAQRNDKGTG